MERDAIEPGAQTGFAVEAANAAEDLDEDLLGDVGGVGGVVEAACDQRVERLMILGDENAKRLLGAGFEVGYCFDLLRTAASELRRSPGETMATTMPGQFGFTIRQPLGVIAGIAPFNAPFLLAMKKVVLALAAGNGFVLKPSELTPVTGLKIAEVFDEAGLPKGLLSVIPGPAAEIGSAIFADPRVRMVTFTGSTQTGRHLAVEAAKSLKKFTLEMGGKSPLIVLADADVDYAVRAAAFGIFFHQGQVCMANSRVLVEEPIFDAFCERFVAVAKSLKVGDPREPDTVIGPLIRGTQCAVIDGHVEDAVGKGATVLCGAKHEKQFYWPTVLKGVTPDMRIFHEESFGPVTSIIRSKITHRGAGDRQQHVLWAVLRRHHQRHAKGPRLRFQA